MDELFRHGISRPRLVRSCHRCHSLLVTSLIRQWMPIRPRMDFAIVMQE